MCTVTFIPTTDGVYLTSNRDEGHMRKTAIHPQTYQLPGGMTLLCPLDADRGGTWIAARQNGDAVVLLNGADSAHLRRPPYRESRGIILLQLLEQNDPAASFDQMELQDIEPFTLVLYCDHRLFECQWDGRIKTRQMLDPRQPQIWSSSTLYDEEVKSRRREWFQQWRNRTPELTSPAILDFHHHAGNTDTRNALVMKRGEQMSTVSISQIFITKSFSSMSYLDLRQQQHYDAVMPLSENITKRTTKPLRRWQWKLRTTMIRLLHWEYWPFHVLYLPVYIYWLWLSIRARSFFFFSAANPLIQNAGFLLESKIDIYRLLPKASYPETILVQPGLALEELKEKISASGLSYPLIAKPDIGQRGVLVKLLECDADLEQYLGKVRVDFLVQLYVPYQQEIGVFYYRIPGEKQGRVTGIVEKGFLQITGDGRSTIEELIWKDDRALLQWKTLARSLGEEMYSVLPEGERKELVPYGNHSRGALFIDSSHKASEAFCRTMDELCQQIPEFYYGRLDIRFESWESLERGERFSIIELNGAGSEPTHIYDPRHSVFFGWKEIMRHWNILFRISLLNAKRLDRPLMSRKEGLRMLRENARYLKLLE